MNFLTAVLPAPLLSMKSTITAKPTTQLAAALILALLVSGCRVGPKHQLPQTKMPASFKGGGTTGESPRPLWWQVFEDPELSELVQRIEQDNFDLRAALARVDQAYAVLGVNRSQRVPNITANGLVQRNRTSANDLGGRFFSNYLTQYRAGLALGWEIDLWGRVRSLVDASAADAVVAQAGADDVRLALQAQLARNYFALRFLDEEKRVLESAVKTRVDNLDLAKIRFEGGRSGELDVARADTELAATQAALVRLKAPRTRLENAIAVLVGETPSDFRLAEKPVTGGAPQVAAGLPMKLLDNRPDVAAARAQLVAANARIGVAVADYYPRVNLVGSGGLSSINAGDFFDWSSRTFSIGPEVTLPIFQAGRIRSNVKRTRAAHAEAVAAYQQTVLGALLEVEDALADLAALRDESVAQAQAVKASNRALELSNRRYQEGLVSSIEVVDAVREELTAERRAVQIRGQQFEATVRLIQALGGGISEQHIEP